MADTSPMSDPNLGEGPGDVLSGEALENEFNGGLVGVVRNLVSTTWAPLAELPGAGDVGSVQRVLEGRTLVRETVLTGGVPESLSGADTSVWEPAPHGAEPDAPAALKVALQVKAVRAFIVCLVAVGTLFQLGYSV